MPIRPKNQSFLGELPEFCGDNPGLSEFFLEKMRKTLQEYITEKRIVIMKQLERN